MSKYKLDKSAQVVENQNYTMTQEEVCERLNDLEAKLAEAQKPKEIRFNGFVVDCNYDEARKVLQEDLLKMQAENNKLKESEELSNYAKCILENKKLEEDLELSEKCCVEYERETQELKKQLAEKTLTIEQINKAFIENRSLWKGKYEQSNQDKISFTIERLEKVKEKLLEELQNVTDLLDPLEYEDYHEFIGCGRGYKNSIEEIDNQINELKEMK